MPIDPYTGLGVSSPTVGGGGVYRPPRSSYSPRVANFNSGFGNPAVMGRGDSATADRPFALVGKGRLNLLDPLSRQREYEARLAAGGIEPVDEHEGPLGFVQDYYDPSNPAGLVGGLVGALGQTLGGIFGQGGAKVGLEVGGAIGKTLDIPFNAISSMPLPTMFLPFIDDVNAEVEKATPYLFQDIVKVPKTAGDVFASGLNALGLLGRGMERTFAGMREMPADLRARVDAGEIDEDLAYDMMVREGRGYTDDPIVNLIAAIALDPLNWATLGVGAVGASLKGSIKLAEVLNKAGKTLNLAEHGASLGHLGDLARAGKVFRDEDIAQLSRLDSYRLRSTMVRQGINDAERNPMVNLALLARTHLIPSAREVLGHVDQATTSNLFYRSAMKAIRITDPITFLGGRLFGTGNIGKRQMELLATAGNAAIFSTYGPLRIRRLAEIAGDQENTLMDAIGVFDANLIQEYALSEHIADGMRAGKVPIVSGGGHSLSPTEAARGITRMGAFDINIGKHMEILLQKQIPTLLARRAGETEEALMSRLLQESRSKLQSLFGPAWDPNLLKMADLDENMAALIHAAYYYGKGAAFHNGVVPAMVRARGAGTLPSAIDDPTRLTLLAERQLTSQRAAELQAAVKARNGALVRSLIGRYKNFDWLDGGQVPDSDMLDRVGRWLDTNMARLPREADLIDPATGQRYAGLPDELEQWMSDADAGFGYTLAEAPPDNIPRPDLYGAIRDSDGMLEGMDPWLDFLPNPEQALGPANWSPAVPTRAQAYFSNVTRHVRQERIRWESQRRFITDMSKGSDSNGIDVAPAVSQKLWRTIMSEAEHQRVQPRGLAPDDMARIVRRSIEEGKKVQDGTNLALENLSHHQVMNALLRATKGDLWTVGATQWFTGRVKANLPGARQNFWGRISENLFPQMRFTLNPVFQVQETAEPYILNRMRGVAAPLDRNSPKFKEALATHNAIMQLARTSVEPDGMMAESAEYLRLFASDYLGVRQNFGPQTVWGRISAKFRPGIGERKAALAALEAKQNIGERFYRTLVAMKGEEQAARLWREMEENARSIDRGDVAMKWIATEMHLADVNGNEVAQVADLLNAHNFGPRFRISFDETPGAMTFKDLERHLDGVLQYDDGRTVTLYNQRLKPDGTAYKKGDALIAELKSMSEQDWMLQTQRIKGIVADDEALRTIWRMANAPTVEEFAKKYRDGFLQTVRGSSRAETRRLRDQELDFHRQLMRVFAAAEGITEQEWIARHFNDTDYVRTVANTVLNPPAGTRLYDIRASFFTDALGKRELDIGNVHLIDEDFRFNAAEPKWADRDDYLYRNVPIANLPSAGGLPLTLPQAAIARQWASFDDLIHEGWGDSTLIRLKKQNPKRPAARFLAGPVPVPDPAGWDIAQTQYHTLLDELDTNEMEVWDLGAERWRPMRESQPYRPAVPAHAPPPPQVSAMYVPPGVTMSKTPGIYGVDIDAMTTEGMAGARTTYKGAGYAEMNTWLRGVEYNGQVTIANIERTIEDLQDLVMAGALAEPRRLWRGVNLSRVEYEFPDSPMTIDYENLMEGDVFTDPAFLSFSSEEGVASMFAMEGGHKYVWEPGETHKSVIITLDAPIGMNMAFVPGFEHEHVIGTGQPLRATKVVKTETPATFGRTHIHYEVHAVPEGLPDLPRTKRIVLEELTPMEQVNTRFVRDAIVDPDGLRLNAGEHVDELGDVGAREVERVIREAEQYVPPTRIDPDRSLMDDAAVLDEFEIEAAGNAYADLRLRLQDVGGTDANGMRILHGLARAVAQEGGMRLGWKELLRRLEDLWARGPGGAVSPTVASLDRALFKGVKHMPSEPLDSAMSDALDVMLGNRSRRATGRGELNEPVLVDTYAMLGAGYDEAMALAPNAYTHEYVVDFYNKKARQANITKWQGRKDWSAADMALITSRRFEKESGKSGIAVDPDEVLRSQRTLAPGFYPPPTSTVHQFAPIIDILQQPENKEQLVRLTEELGVRLGMELRDRLGIPVMGMDGRGIGLLESGPAHVLPTTFLSSEGKADEVADIVAYATGQEVWGFNVVDVDELTDLKALVPRVVFYLPPMPPSMAKDVASKMLRVFEKKGAMRGAHASASVDGDWVIEVMDEEGIFPRLDDGSLDIDAFEDEMQDVYDNIGELGIDDEVAFEESYGTVYKAGPPLDETGVPNWEGHRDAVEARLQERGSRFTGDDLDRVRSAFESTYRDNLASDYPKQYRRVVNGEPVQPNVLEDRRGGSVRGYTDIGADGRATIAAVGQPDVVTGLHELTHIFARSLDPSAKARIMAAYDADLTLARDDLTQRVARAQQRAAAASTQSVRTRFTNEANALQHELGGLVDVVDWGTEHEEFFVSQFLKYIRAGRTPNPEFTNAMEHFRNHIELLKRELFPKTAPNVPFSPQMREFFDHVLRKPTRDMTVPYSLEQETLRMAFKQQIRDAWDEAHGTHYYRKDRRWFERSINHPYLGVYPASYMWGKVLPEMFRFLALRPFGYEAPMLGWNVLREVSETTSYQAETNDDFKQFLSDNDRAFMLFSMLFPAVPNDISANASLPLRRVAEQSLMNQYKNKMGAEFGDETGQIHDINYLAGLEDATMYAIGPLGAARTAGEVLGLVQGGVEGATQPEVNEGVNVIR